VVGRTLPLISWAKLTEGEDSQEGEEGRLGRMAKRTKLQAAGTSGSPRMIGW